jgi:hypothetical protein
MATVSGLADSGTAGAMGAKMKNKNSVQAFPAIFFDGFTGTGAPIYEGTSGMTLRDWFAGQGMCMFGTDNLICAKGKQDRRVILRAMALCAYEYADAMLAARES